MTTSPAEPIPVVLVAHHALVGEAVATALASRGVLVTLPSGRSGRDVVELQRHLADLRPVAGLILRDIGDPVQLCDTVRLVATVPLAWLLLTSCRDDSRWGAVVEAGVRGVIPMSEGIDEVETVVRAVAAGSPVLDEERRREVLHAWTTTGRRHRALVTRMGELTPREMTVLGLLASGLAVTRIAERLHVAEGTVRSQVKSVRAKLGVSSQLAAVAAYRQVVRIHDDPAVPAPERH